MRKCLKCNVTIASNTNIIDNITTAIGRAKNKSNIFVIYIYLLYF